MVKSYSKVKRCFNGMFVRKLVEFIFEDLMRSDMEAMEKYLETMDERYEETVNEIFTPPYKNIYFLYAKEFYDRHGGFQGSNKISNQIYVHVKIQYRGNKLISTVIISSSFLFSFQVRFIRKDPEEDLQKYHIPQDQNHRRHVPPVPRIISRHEK